MNENVKKVLQTWGKETVAEMVAILKLKSKEATGKLLQSLKSDLREGLEQIVLEIEMEDYGKWVDKGRRAGEKMPPKEPIEKWMELKGIDLKYSFPIRRKIGRDGIEAVNFFEVPLLLKLEMLDAPLQDAMRQDLLDRVAAMADKINK